MFRRHPVYNVPCLPRHRSTTNYSILCACVNVPLRSFALLWELAGCVCLLLLEILCVSGIRDFLLMKVSSAAYLRVFYGDGDDYVWTNQVARVDRVALHMMRVMMHERTYLGVHCSSSCPFFHVLKPNDTYLLNESLLGNTAFWLVCIGSMLK